jgi:hypothetical protein
MEFAATLKINLFGARTVRPVEKIYIGVKFIQTKSRRSSLQREPRPPTPIHHSAALAGQMARREAADSGSVVAQTGLRAGERMALMVGSVPHSTPR